jgi:hypothetical protein
MNRRQFVTVTAIGAGGALLAQGLNLGECSLLGNLRVEPGSTPVPGAKWHLAEAVGDGMEFRFPKGALAGAKCIASDMLLDGREAAVFAIVLREGEKGRAFRFSFGALNQCSFRVRMDLGLVDQSRWMVDREGAFLKPICGGDRVDLSQVDRLTLTLSRKGPSPVRWCMTELRAAAEMPPRLTNPALPKGPLLDEFGQSALLDWPGKTRGAGELKARLRGQLESAAEQTWPETFSRWGGWKSKKVAEGTGFFRTHNDGRRWWLVDPDGYAFWSAGLDCVRVDTDARVDGIEAALKWMPSGPAFADALRGGERGGAETRVVNFLAANMIRAFGPDGWRDKWARTVLAEMKRLRFNTVGNWSEFGPFAKARFPYVRPINFRATRSGMVYRDFPDVFHKGFEQDATDYAGQLRTTLEDPALIGYFLMNEPTWAFSSELPATGLLYNSETCSTRDELARFLRRKYDRDAALAAAWKTPATFEKVGRGKWQGVLPNEAMADLREFSGIMVERYFQALSKACRQVDSKHLNLGMRWQGIPKDWAVPGMKSFDVFSLNCYQDKLPRDTAEKIASLLKMPVLVGEWHFGALDAGLPASGIGHLKNQTERAKAYRIYLEDAAADPYCVGVHWFTLYDQSALGRFDGENYNIGFLDVCNRAYDELGRGAVASHERMYQVAAGQAKAFAESVEYLPKLFL